ncbi:17090_t:CDS:2, partial [Acaulospora morrowiae]
CEPHFSHLPTFSNSTVRQYSSVHGELSEVREELRKLGHGTVEFNPSFSPGIGLITLQNVERRNALSGRMMAQLADLVDRLERIVKGETSVREEEELVALILTGSGNTFCSGFDLSVAKEHILTSENGAKMSSLMQDTLFRFSQLPLISVAAIEGHALGGGAELSTACDHRCISDTAKVRFVQVKMATTPGWGGGGRLIKIVGKTSALRIMGASVPLTGKDALDVGFADILAVNNESVLDKSIEYLDPYVYFFAQKEGESVPERRRNSVRAVRGIKAITARADNDEAHKEFLRWEHRLFADYWGQEENVAAVIGSSKKEGK